MANLAKFEFAPLDLAGNNYLSWVLDVTIHLKAKGLGDTIKKGNQATDQDKAIAMIFIRHHLDEGLKHQYLTVEDPLELWAALKERYDHQKTVILPKARNDWIHLRLQDFKSVSTYNSAIFKISSQLKLCGEKVTDEDMLEKIFFTFHASNVLLQQQYREKGFKKYSELISCLLVAELNNELLLKNHEARPTGTAPFPEANVVAASSNNRNYRGRGRGRNFGRGRGRYNNRGGYNKNTTHHQKWENHDEKVEQKKVDNKCYRCGMKGHWSRTCRTPKHLADLYQESMKNKGKNIETNFLCDDVDLDNGFTDFTSLDVADFFGNHPEGEPSHSNALE